jgi:hypothetical protein
MDVARKQGRPAGTPMDAASAAYTLCSAPRYDPKTKVGSIAIGSRIQLDCLRAKESGSRAFWLYH